MLRIQITGTAGSGKSAAGSQPAQRGPLMMRIQITGPKGSGKSSVEALIRHTLMQHGADVAAHDFTASGVITTMEAVANLQAHKPIRVDIVTGVEPNGMKRKGAAR